VQVWLDGVNLNFCSTIKLKFQLDRTLFGKRIKLQLKPIHLADVYKQTELEIPHLHKALNVGRNAMTTQLTSTNNILPTFDK
jgi:hypothetical protein